MQVAPRPLLQHQLHLHSHQINRLQQRYMRIVCLCLAGFLYVQTVVPAWGVQPNGNGQLCSVLVAANDTLMLFLVM